MRSIRVFDDGQRKDAKEQAKAMRGSDQPFQECIEFGRTWYRGNSYSSAHALYEAAKKAREQDQGVEDKRARLLRELEELEELEESA